MESTNVKPLLDPISSDTDEDEIRITNINDDRIVVVKDEAPLFKPQEPRDKYLVVFFIFYLLGMTTLLPWNFFITANDYWMYKFRDPNSQLNFFSPPPKRTPLQASFTSSYLSIASNIPAVIFLIVNTVLSKRISVKTRMIGSLMCMLILFIITTAFVKINTDLWQEEFFIVTLTTVVLLNVASAILSGTVFGIVGKFSPKYITALVGGQALGAIFTAIVQIIALSVGISSVFAAFIYFIVGNIMIILSLIAYIILTKAVYFKFHLSNKMTLNEFQNDLVRPQFISYKVILKKIWPYGLSVFIVFLITLSIYPGVTVLIESEEKGHGNKWNDVYFVPVISYLLFSCGDYTGRIVAGLIQWPRKGSLLLIFSVMRLGFIPLLLLCNAQSRQYLPVIFNKDYYYVAIMMLFALTNGYLANLSVMCAPRVVKHHEKETASSLIAIFLGCGLSAGAAVSLIFVKVI